ncbi:hypothetical protein DTO96_101305 [Ephemeroptericola cinctiostellae]|uniref:Abortive phage infection protein C-terminal domain-containing protein n=1 Tax=Ephemeroptericola cinctiostellae TaxID=2268024 RepID=A0A345DB36_9BURK|nr:AIPR family protein [Ephemeroptericola cinctiostellae]AXF85574.1 hypothetical protein DTO96_101305 [Ephemeroptericola cinctiostellae]
MTAIQAEFKQRLEQILKDRFVASMPKTKSTCDEAKSCSRALAAFALNKRLDIKPQEAAKSVIDDVNDHGIDAIYYHKAENSEEDGTLYLVQAKLNDNKNFEQEDALCMMDGVRKILRQEFDSFNDLVKNRQTEIVQALDECTHIQLLVIYTGNDVSQTAKQKFDTLFNDRDDLDERLCQMIDYFSPQEIEDKLREEQSHKPIHTDLYLTKSQKIDQDSLTYYGLVNITDMIDLHVQHGKALFEHNIRYFLGTSKSTVNQSIQKTLREHPQQFFYLNNGITAIAEIIEPKSNHNRGKSGIQKIKVRGLSIINGAQTISTCADFAQNNPDVDLSAAKVMFTLIKADARAFGAKITKARNHQNPVTTNNFAALDPIQERIRQDIAVLNEGYVYSYRPEAIVNSTHVIRLEDALNALLLVSNNPTYPAQIKHNANALNHKDSSAYKEVFTEDLRAIKLLNATLVYQTLQSVILDYERGSQGQEKLVLRHGKFVIIAVMMKCLKKNWIDLERIIDIEKLKNTLSSPLDELRQQIIDSFISTAYKGPLAFFKSQVDVVDLMDRIMRTHFWLVSDIALDKMPKGLFDKFPKESRFNYMVQRAPQIEFREAQ